MKTLPVKPERDAPEDTFTAPDCPARVAPEATLRAPLAPSEAAPVASSALPLDALPTASFVRSERWPDPPALPEPVATDTLPPAAVDEDEKPAEISTAPPSLTSEPPA